MSSTEHSPSVDISPATVGNDGGFARLARIACLCALIATLAWAPFPLGSAVSWGAPLLEMMIAVAWLLWALSTTGEIRETIATTRFVRLPLALGSLVLFWALIQLLPIAPAGWVHPVWTMAAAILHEPVLHYVSIDPWRTQSDLLNLAAYAGAFWLALCLARRPETASVLLNAIVVIEVAYALYGFALALLDVAQAGLVYGLPFARSYISGPFMLHNSFATYAGLGTLAAMVKLFDLGRESIVLQRGARQLALTVLQFAFGRGGVALVAALLTFSAVIASASRAGFVSTAIALLAMSLVFAILAKRSETRLFTIAAAAVAAASVFVVIMLSGGSLGDRLAQLADAGEADQMRIALWSAATRMIADAPWRGLGMGTFQDAYPLYARIPLPFVMDKAHCDYLEFAAGVGLPAAIAWWVALGWLAFVCLRGTFSRRRNRHFALLAFCATVLVATHASVDFSLQVPAVGILYAVILGLGVAQSQRSRAAR